MSNISITHSFASGVHPEYAAEYTDEVHSQLCEAATHPRCVAWGECGLNFRRSPSTHLVQKEVFARQILAAVSLDKPVVVFGNRADEGIKEVLQANMPTEHSFSINSWGCGAELVKWIIESFPNAYISVAGGLSTSPHIEQLIKSGELPLQRVLLASSSPFMIPQEANDWLRKTMNSKQIPSLKVSHSAMIPFTAERVVKLVNKGKGTGEAKVTLEEVLEITAKNAEKFYGIQME